MKVPSFNHDLVFLVMRPHLGAIQGATQNYLIRTRDTPIIQKNPMVFRGSVSGTKVEDQILKQRMILVLLEFRKLQSV